MIIRTDSIALLAFALFVTACDKDDDQPDDTATEGKLTVEITDAPIDDADVEAVFVTVAEVRVNGEASAAFPAAKTIELSAYSGGSTFRLAEDIAVDAEADARVEIVLDVESDATATGPGAYVLRADGTKDPLAFGTANVVTLGAAAAFDIEADATTRVVADLDLRKAVERDDSGAEPDYTFLSEARLRSSSRMVDVGLTGEVTGSAEAGAERPEGEILVVYAFAAGSYSHDAAVESDFAEATASATVDAEGEYAIAFLPAGEYEIVTASYVPAEADGRAELRGTLAVDALGTTDVRNVRVDARASALLSLDLGDLML